MLLKESTKKWQELQVSLEQYDNVKARLENWLAHNMSSEEAEQLVFVLFVTLTKDYRGNCDKATKAFGKNLLKKNW